MSHWHKCKDRRILAVWKAMMNRCYNKNNAGFPSYGGRGITVCEEWHDGDKFAEWALSKGYGDGYSIERIDNNGSYSPSNCRLASKKEQANNRRTNVFLEYKGERKTIANWANELGIPDSTLRFRIKNGWRIEDALTVPVSYHNENINRRNIKRSDDLLAFQS